MSVAFYIVVFGIFFYVLTCIALLDIALREFADPLKKVLWVFATMVPFFGVLVYFFYGRKKSTPRSKMPKPASDDAPAAP